MNRDRVRQLADRIEFEDRFNYTSFFATVDGDWIEGRLDARARALAHKCGTVGCIAGWAVVEAWKAGTDLNHIAPDGDEVQVLAEWLEIHYDVADNVAYGGLFPEGLDDGKRHAMNATAVEAAKALREWADGDREIEGL